MQLTWLNPLDEDSPFPPLKEALDYPEGLLAAGGDLSVTRLLKAYRSGIFPWYENDQPILWWSPDPRGILYPEKFRLTRSLRKSLRNKPWQITFDKCFYETMQACAQPRDYARGTWITRDMIKAYCNLFDEGYAHSVEVWNEEYRLIGGLYGISIGKMYFGESMFSRKSEASKVAFAYLVAHLQSWGFPMIDCQLPSTHLATLGAEAISREQYLKQLAPLVSTQPTNNQVWKFNPELDVSNWDPKTNEFTSLDAEPDNPAAPAE